MEHRHTQDVQLFKDGVKIGWSVLALLASVGLAFYVSSVINPIVKEQQNTNDRLQQLNLKVQEEHKIMRLKLQEINTFQATTDLRLKQLDSQLKVN